MVSNSLKTKPKQSFIELKLQPEILLKKKKRNREVVKIKNEPNDEKDTLHQKEPKSLKH